MNELEVEVAAAERRLAAADAAAEKLVDQIIEELFAGAPDWAARATRRMAETQPEVTRSLGRSKAADLRTKIAAAASKRPRGVKSEMKAADWPHRDTYRSQFKNDVAGRDVLNLVGHLFEPVEASVSALMGGAGYVENDPVYANTYSVSPATRRHLDRFAVDTPRLDELVAEYDLAAREAVAARQALAKSEKELARRTALDVWGD